MLEQCSAHSQATLAAPGPDHCSLMCHREPGDAVAAWEWRQHMLVELWLFSQHVCPPTYLLRGSKELCSIQKRKKRSEKEIFPLLPTLEKYAQVMSLFGISQRWESGKPGRALSMPSVLMKCTWQHQPLALHSTEGSF